MGMGIEVPVDSLPAPLAEALTDSVPPPMTGVPADSLAAPMADVPANSSHAAKSKVTLFRVAAGGGDHAQTVRVGSAEGCESIYLKEQFIDAGVEVDHQVNRLFHLGARAGYISEEAELARPLPIDPDTNLPIEVPPGVETDVETYYLNPFLSLEWTWLGVGAGVVGSTEPLENDGEDNDDQLDDEDSKLFPSFHVRLGKTSAIYASWHVSEGVPIYSGGGLNRLGLGMDFIPHLHLWGGQSYYGPYVNESWVGQMVADVSRSWSVDATYRFKDEPNDSGVDEWGLAFGLRYRLYRRRPTRRCGSRKRKCTGWRGSRIFCAPEERVESAVTVLDPTSERPVSSLVTLRGGAVW